MYKQRSVGTKKATKAVDKAKKKRTNKIIKGGKAKNKQINASGSISKDSMIPSATEIGSDGSAVSKSESWSLTQSIRQFVRQEVEEALMKTSSKRERVKEASSKENIRKDNEYVRLEDLTDIVSQLVSRHVVESVFETNSEQLQETAEKVLSLEECLKDLSARMEAVEETVSQMQKGFLSTSAGSQRSEGGVEMSKSMSVSQMQKGFLSTSAGSQRSEGGVEMSKSMVRFQLPDDEHPFVSRALPRLGSASKIRLPIQQKDIPSTDDDTDDDSEDLQSNPSSMEVNKDKPSVYTDLINKICRKTGGQQSDPASARRPLQTADLQRRKAERQQFEANMLWYKKSPLTLQVDNHKNLLPNRLCDPVAAEYTPPRPLTRSTNQRSIPPRLARPGASVSSEDGQSDWLFEQ